MKTLTVANYYNNLIHPEKYVGKVKIITIRSSYELKMVNRLDNDTSVIEWSSEDIVIPYIIPFKNTKRKVRNYYVDFYYKTKNNEEFLVEVKPAKDCIKPIIVRKSPYYMNQMINWVINNLKWEACIAYCKHIQETENRNIKFVIFTEKELGISK